MRDCWKALLITSALIATQAHASEASDALLNADRAMATQSRAIGFGPALAKTMGADARKFDRGSPPAIGRESILAVLAKYDSDLQLDWTPDEAVVAKSGELGYTWGHFVAKSHNKKGELETDYGVYMDVWRRDDDGTWRWIADMGVATPPPGEKAKDDHPTTTAPAAEKNTSANTQVASSQSKQSNPPKGNTMAKVLGIGGVFFKSQDPAKLGAWYKEHLGMPYDKYGAFLPVTELPPTTKIVWTPFAQDTTYFAPSTQPFMLNLIVDNVDQVLEQVKQGGGTIVGEPEDYPYGRFGRFIDPDGNKVEIWEVKKSN